MEHLFKQLQQQTSLEDVNKHSSAGNIPITLILQESIQVQCKLCAGSDTNFPLRKNHNLNSTETRNIMTV